MLWGALCGFKTIRARLLVVANGGRTAADTHFEWIATQRMYERIVRQAVHVACSLAGTGYSWHCRRCVDMVHYCCIHSNEHTHTCSTPIKRIPTLGGRELDVYHLYCKVLSLGGSETVGRQAFTPSHFKLRSPSPLSLSSSLSPSPLSMCVCRCQGIVSGEKLPEVSTSLHLLPVPLMLFDSISLSKIAHL